MKTYHFQLYLSPYKIIKIKTYFFLFPYGTKKGKKKKRNRDQSTTVKLFAHCLGSGKVKKFQSIIIIIFENFKSQAKLKNHHIIFKKKKS